MLKYINTCQTQFEKKININHNLEIYGLKLSHFTLFKYSSSCFLCICLFYFWKYEYYKCILTTIPICICELWIRTLKRFLSDNWNIIFLDSLYVHISKMQRIKRGVWELLCLLQIFWIVSILEKCLKFKCLNFGENGQTYETS